MSSLFSLSFSLPRLGDATTTTTRLMMMSGKHQGPSRAGTLNHDESYVGESLARHVDVDETRQMALYNSLKSKVRTSTSVLFSNDDAQS